LKNFKNFLRTGKPQNTESKCPELLANYCDLLLRKSALTKRYTCDEIDERLNNVVSFNKEKNFFLENFVENFLRIFLLIFGNTF